MPIPPWIYSASPEELEGFNITPDLSALDKKSIYITDARRVGIMLRDKRLTLRNHAALTRFVIEAVSDQDFLLQTPVVGDNPYVTVGSKGAFRADGSKDKAQKFQLRATEVGIELYLAGQRPAVFDDFYDVSVGRWETGLSPIALLIHTDVAKIWKSYDNTPSRNNGSGGSLGSDSVINAVTVGMEAPQAKPLRRLQFVEGYWIQCRLDSEGNNVSGYTLAPDLWTKNPEGQEWHLSQLQLCEIIFLNLPIIQLLIAIPRVCKQWQAIINRSHDLQKALFFRPMQSQAVIPNPFFDEAKEWYNHSSWPHKLQRDEASWRRMLVSQPPPAQPVEIKTPQWRAIFEPPYFGFRRLATVGLSVADRMWPYGPPRDIAYPPGVLFLRATKESLAREVIEEDLHEWNNWNHSKASWINNGLGFMVVGL